jgi:hypothetical protein
MNYGIYALQLSALPFAAALMLALLLCLLVVGYSAMEDSDDETALVRGFQWLRMKSTHMPQMLKQRGIDPAAYYRATPVSQAKVQIDRCNGCQSKARCEKDARESGERSSEFSYCANAAIVGAFAARLEGASPQRLDRRTAR